MGTGRHESATVGMQRIGRLNLIRSKGVLLRRFPHLEPSGFERIVLRFKGVLFKKKGSSLN